MNTPYYESFKELLTSGFRISYVTAPGGYHPKHWHEELEILFHLNGDSDITIDGKEYHLEKKHMITIDSRQIHSTCSYDPASMFICIHISKSYMEKYIPGLEKYQIRCTPENIRDDNFQDYLDICMLLQDLTQSYIKEPITLSMETEGYILLILARLVQHFSSKDALAVPHVDILAAERIRTIIAYVQEHFREPINLNDIAGKLGLEKEYFCRFFKKYMNMSFLQYLNEIRVSHIYQDLENTSLSIAEIMEKNGFTNQKLFNRTFKSLYGCTPSSVRKNRKNCHL